MIYFFFKKKFFFNKNYFIFFIKNMVRNEKFVIKNLNFIFCNDKFLLKINKKFLKHKTYTDVITFNNLEKRNYNNKIIYGDIFISVDTVRYNAKKYHEKFLDEIKRVMIHGILHLIGYNDYYDYEKYLMKKKEEFYINLWK